MPRERRSIELFGGCGGLGLGLAQAGFRSLAFLEWDDDAAATVRHNQQRKIDHFRDWNIVHDDVRNVDWKPYGSNLSLVSGGPPCQPFGIGGLKKGHLDPRDMWPEAIRAVRETRPEAFLFENVRNLAGPSFRDYLAWVEVSLRHASDTRLEEEGYLEHLNRLRAEASPPDYLTSVSKVNAADYGAPQDRHRVLIAGIRADLGVAPGHPKPTHSRDRLLWDQWVTGEYWKRHRMERPKDSAIPKRHLTIVRKLRDQLLQPPGLPWVTLRDAIADLGEPKGKNHHVFQPGARVYKGHTGSPLDWPSKALKAGDHGVPGGENMMILPDGSVRYLTLREAARLVGLPDEYAFPASWSESMRQLGNAVPARLAEAVGRWLAQILDSAEAAMSKAAARKTPTTRRAKAA
jgi:DNA (cytosine-5)-methyltransferase 1